MKIVDLSQYATATVKSETLTVSLQMKGVPHDIFINAYNDLKNGILTRFKISATPEAEGTFTIYAEPIFMEMPLTVVAQCAVVQRSLSGATDPTTLKAYYLGVMSAGSTSDWNMTDIVIP